MSKYSAAWLEKIPKYYLKWLLISLLSVLGFAIVHYLYILKDLAFSSLGTRWSLIGIGTIVLWRWSWLCSHLIRSPIYLNWVFPRWRKKADAIGVEYLPPVCIVVTTYKANAWVTQKVFRSIANEAKTLPQPPILLVNSSSTEENAAIKEILKSVDPELSHLKVIFAVQKQGTRNPMADALRHLASFNLPENTVVALVDGNSEIAPGTLNKCIPFFRLFPKLGALTTDQLSKLKGPRTFFDWFNLRFAQRHCKMSSLSLSGKILSLRGGFSLFRSETALHPDFANNLEDEKNSWYWLLQRGYDMIYVPDTIVYSLETVFGSPWERAYENLQQWYANILPNSDRALSLGPTTTGWFPWSSLLDWRIGMWTSLITPSLFLISLLKGDPIAAIAILLWVMVTRPLVLALIFWGRKSKLKLIHLPLFVATQWGSAAVKIWTQIKLIEQKWIQRGDRSVPLTASSWQKWLENKTFGLPLISQAFCFILLLLWLNGLISPVEELLGGWWAKERYFSAPEVPTEIITAADRGIVPNDGRDDATAIQKLIDQSSTSTEIEVQLPTGEIDLFEPLVINRGNLILNGQGIGKTIFRVHFDIKKGDAAIAIRPTIKDKDKSPDIPLSNIKLKNFTLTHVNKKGSSPSSYIDSLVLENAQKVILKSLDLEENNSRHSIILNRTGDVTIEYVAVGNNSKNADPIVRKNDINTTIRGLSD
ncbi:MAG: glycosyltransferase [Prochloraceae cyanobacterium]|nr:glycosyltransferase [Prochloraceae cyanobacterium]